MSLDVIITHGIDFDEVNGDTITPVKLNKMGQNGFGVVTGLPVTVGDGGTGAQTAVAARTAIGFPTKFIEGCELSFSSVAQVKIAVGSLRDESDLNNITVSSILTADIAVSGKDGLDTGAEAIDTWYAVHAIDDSTGLNATASILSLSPTSPTFPSGYDINRRVGWVRNNAASDFREFLQVSSSNHRRYINDVALAEVKALTAGVATAFAAVDLSGFMPETSQEVEIRIDFENVGGTDTDDVVFRTTGSTISEATAAISIGPGILLTTPMKQLTNLITDSSQSIDYAVTAAADSLDLYVLGYIDEV